MQYNHVHHSLLLELPMFRKFRVLKGVPPRPEFEGILLSMKGPDGVYFCIENNLKISNRYTKFLPVQKIEEIQKGDQCGMISAEQIFKPLNKKLVRMAQE